MFLALNKIPLIEYNTACFSIHHWRTSRSLSSFGNCEKSCFNLHAHAIVWTQVFNSFGQTPRSAVAGLHDNSMITFLKRNCQTVVHSDYHFAFPLEMNENSCRSTSLPEFDVIDALDFSHPNRCTMCYKYFLIDSSYLRNGTGGLRKKGELLSSIVFVHSFWKLLTQYILLKKKKSFQKEFRGTLLKATDTYVFK